MAHGNWWHTAVHLFKSRIMPATTYKIEDISSIVKGELFIQDASHSEIELLLTDSRTILEAECSLFFAIKGVRNDGHRFIEELIS